MIEYRANFTFVGFSILFFSVPLCWMEVTGVRKIKA